LAGRASRLTLDRSSRGIGLAHFSVVTSSRNGAFPDRLYIRRVRLNASLPPNSRGRTSPFPPAICWVFLLEKRIFPPACPKLSVSRFLAGCLGSRVQPLCVKADNFSLPGPGEPCWPYEPLPPLEQQNHRIFNDVLICRPVPRVRLISALILTNCLLFRSLEEPALGHISCLPVNFNFPNRPPTTNMGGGVKCPWPPAARRTPTVADKLTLLQRRHPWRKRNGQNNPQ